MRGAWRRSLIGQILLVELAAIAVAALVLPSVTVSMLRQTMLVYQRNSLVEQAQDVARELSLGPDAQLRVALTPARAQLYATPYDGRAFAVIDRDGRLVARSRFAAGVPWDQAPRSQRPRSFRAGTFVGASLPVVVAGRHFWVLVSQDESGPGAILDDVVASFLWRYLALLVVVLLLLLPLVNSLLIHRVTLAVRRVSAQAAEIDAQRLDVRLDERGVPVEVAPLVAATNALVARLAQSFRQQAEFIANVVHELRTPLATLRMRADAVADAPARAALTAQVERISHVVAQLQDLASLDEPDQAALAPIDLGEVARIVVGDRAPAILAAGDTVALDAPTVPVRVCGNATLAEMAIGNLVGNAAKHTPPGTVILVTVRADGSVTVADDGPGIAGAADEVVQRFWRADHQRSDSAGLGLSIVARIMQVHGGTLEIGRAEAGGAAFTLRFRPAAVDRLAPARD